MNSLYSDRDSELSILYNPRTQRYKGVYPSGTPDNPKYLVVVETTIRLGLFDDEKEAARQVIRWYKRKYGPLWQKMVTRNHLQAFRVYRDDVSWIAQVWVGDRVVLVTPERLAPITKVPLNCHWTGRGWNTREAALAAVRIFYHAVNEPLDRRKESDKDAVTILFRTTATLGK